MPVQRLVLRAFFQQAHLRNADLAQRPIRREGQEVGMRCRKTADRHCAYRRAVFRAPAISDRIFAAGSDRRARSFRATRAVRAAKRRASVALPRPSRPANSIVCGMRSRAIMPSSASERAGCPRSSQTRAANASRIASRHFADRRAAVDHDESLRLARGQRQIAVAHPLMEGGAFLVDARFGLPGALVAPSARAPGWSRDRYR